MAIDWQVESLRVTAFPLNLQDISVADLWDQFIGREPDEVQIQRGQFELRGGEFGNGKVLLIRQPDRVDWRYLAKPVGDEPAFAMLGRLSEELPQFQTLAKKWLASSKLASLSRLAFGAVLLAPVENLTGGYALLGKQLPGQDLTDAVDFNYRINRRRTSNSVSELHINRLAQWSVASGGIMNIAVESGVGRVVKPAMDMQFACRLELDINTAADREAPLNEFKLEDLFDELVELGREIADNGDIR